MARDFSKYSDEELVELTARQNTLAFASIVNRYKSDIASVVRGMLGNVAEVEDVGLEVFVRFYNSAKNFRGESSVKTYLTRIAINLSLNEIKRRKRKRWLSFEEKPKEDISLNDDFSKQETKELVDMALNQLEPKFKSVIVLRLIQGYSTKEVAEILDLPIGTVLSRLSRAQQKLRQIILSLEKTYDHG